MKKIVEDMPRFPVPFRPAHPVDDRPQWKGVPVIVRGTTGVVRGGVISQGNIRLFVVTQNWSAWLTPTAVKEYTP